MSHDDDMERILAAAPGNDDLERWQNVFGKSMDRVSLHGIDPDHDVAVIPGGGGNPDAEGSTRISVSMERVLTVDHRIGGKWERLIERTLSKDDCKGMVQFM